VCRGGCTWTSHSLLGKPGNNPYCHYRALELEKQGLRERIVKIREAAPASFAVGEFELITERIGDGQVVTTSNSQRKLVQLRGTDNDKWEPREGRVPPDLDLCRACHCYIWPHDTECPHCGANVSAAAESWAQDTLRREAALNAVKALLDQYRSDQVFSETVG
jgi:hypothetical protein